MQSFFSFLAVWIIIVPLIAGIMLLKRLDRNSFMIFLVVIAGVIPQLLHFYQPKSVAVTIAYNLYSPIEFTLYSLLLYPCIKSAQLKKMYWLSFSIYTVIVGYLLATISVSHRFIGEWVSCNNICYLVWLALVLINDLYAEQSILSFNNPFIWFAIGIFGFAACTAAIYAVWPFIEKNAKSELKYLFTIQNFFNVLIYIFFTIGFLKTSKLNKSSISLSLSTEY
jgi:hypothetical protein